jgi:8-hydroxy-5-deazaflavin:NADPH oxidoreductase
MKIGVIGSGEIGGTIGTLWARAGHEIFFSSRHPEQLVDLVAAAGENTRAGTIAEAAAFANVLLLAVPYRATDEALAACSNLNGKILIDSTNPFVVENSRIQLVPYVSPALELAMKVPRAHIVKAYNTLPMMTLVKESNRTNPYVIFYCGNHGSAKVTVGQLIVDSGFARVDIGNLDQVIHQEPGGSLYNHLISV